MVSTLSFKKLAMSSGVMSKVVMLGALAVPVSVTAALVAEAAVGPHGHYIEYSARCASV